MLVLKNATTVQFNPAQVTKGIDIVIDGTKIIEVAENAAARYATAEVREMNGMIVMPGIVCSHNHFYSGLSRGIMARIAPSPDFISVLKNLWWRLDRALDEESLYYSGLICSLEAIKHGCTAVIDHHASPNYIHGSLNTLRKAFMETGLRGMTCFETTDRNGGMKEVEAGIEENINFAKLIDAAKQKGNEPYLVECHLGAHAPFTIPDDGLKLMYQAKKEIKRGMHIHVAEDSYDVSRSHDVYDLDPIERLANANLLDDKTIIAHGIFLSAKEIELINQHNSFLVHNARSNMNNHVGYNQQLPQYNHVALGTDGIGSDMFEEMKFAFFKHRDAGGNLWQDSFLNMLYNGNILLERNFSAKFGQLAAGYQADLTICDYQSPTPLQAENIAGHIAFGLSSSSVHSVMVNGKMVYENRQFTFDTASIFLAAEKAATALWKRMDALN